MLPLLYCCRAPRARDPIFLPRARSARRFSSRRALGACGGFLPAVRPEARGGFLAVVAPPGTCALPPVVLLPSPRRGALGARAPAPPVASSRRLGGPRVPPLPSPRRGALGARAPPPPVASSRRLGGPRAAPLVARRAALGGPCAPPPPVTRRGALGRPAPCFFVVPRRHPAASLSLREPPLLFPALLPALGFGGGGHGGDRSSAVVSHLLSLHNSSSSSLALCDRI
ncbi:unnamed protein product [Closterium sp. Naga37s-1]|nr:unnamed protein product [Closterium sp. Naga37s-1]